MKAVYTHIILIAALLNLVWELAHSPLYVVLEPSGTYAGGMAWMIFVDVLIVLIIYWIIKAITNNSFWFFNLKKHAWLSVIFGLIISVLVELRALHFRVWSYGPQMPIIPVFNVGLTPVLQMIIVPLVTFWAIKKKHSKTFKNYRYA